MDIEEIIKTALSNNDEKEIRKTRLQLAADAGMLLELFNSLERSYHFSVGDLVEFKPGLEHNKNEGVWVITKILDEPVMGETTNHGSCYYREMYDVIAGCMKNGVLLEFHYDSRRFQPYTGPMPEDV